MDLTFDLDQIISQIIDFLPRLGLGLVVFLITLIIASGVSRFIKRRMSSQEVDPELVVLLQLLGKWGVRILGIVIALETIAPGRFGSLVAGLGIAGFTIGFALQDIAKNFIAGLLLLLQQPFNIGDAVEVAGYAGTVENIALRTTEIRTWDGQFVLVPNGDVFVSPVINFTKSRERRVEIILGVANESDLDRVTHTALEAVKDLDGILDDPAPSVLFQQFGDFAIQCTLYCWFDTQQIAPASAVDACIKVLKPAFEREGIDLPYPIQKVISITE